MDDTKVVRLCTEPGCNKEAIGEYEGWKYSFRFCHDHVLRLVGGGTLTYYSPFDDPWSRILNRREPAPAPVEQIGHLCGFYMCRGDETHRKYLTQKPFVKARPKTNLTLTALRASEARYSSGNSINEPYIVVTFQDGAEYMVFTGWLRERIEEALK